MHICKTAALIWQEQKQTHMKPIRMVTQGEGWRNGSGNENKREQINKAIESIMIMGHVIV